LQWLKPNEDVERDNDRRRHLRDAALVALSFLVAALSERPDISDVLDQIERHIARFTVRAEGGARHPTRPEPAAVDLSTAQHEALVAFIALSDWGASPASIS
jgi:hypothetical protein